MQVAVKRLRLLGHGGLQISAVLVPLLVFQMTKEPSLAGIAILVEWLPKLVLYASGGCLVRRFSRSTVHVAQEALRLGAYVVFTLATLGYLNVWWVAAGAAVYQCANALSNILFETLIADWWPEAERSQGYIKLIRKEQEASLLALLLAAALQSAIALAIAGCILQSGLFLTTLRYVKKIHVKAPPSFPNEEWRKRATEDWQAIRKSNLLHLAGLSILAGVSTALIFSSLTFFFDRALPGTGNNLSVLSLFLILKTASAVLLLTALKRQAKTPGRLRRLAQTGILLCLICSMLAVQKSSLAQSILLALTLNLTLLLYVPWGRHQRQVELTRCLPAERQLGAMGLLIAIESSVYPIAALIMTATNNSLELAFFTAAALQVCALPVAHKVGLLTLRPRSARKNVANEL